MKKIILLILPFMLLSVSAPVYAGVEDYKGMWACMTTDSFGYQDGKRVNFTDEKFFLKMKKDTISYSGDENMGKGTLKIVVKFDMQSEGTVDYLTARTNNEIINFHFKTNKTPT